MTKHIMILAGEASGDHHAAQVVQALKQDHPHYSFSGMAGPAMREAGVTALVTTESMAVMGFAEVIANFKIIYCAYQKIKRTLQTNPPDLVILVDYPGFNLKIAALAKGLGIKVLYYVSPQLWAWKSGRIKKIKACVDKMAVIFPFEVDFYQRAGVSVEYVGSPLAETLELDLTKNAACEKIGLAINQPTLVLLPGSRQIEIKRILPVMFAAAKKILQQYPNIQLVLPVASTLPLDQIAQQIKLSNLPITLLKGQAHTAIRASDVALCTSGTVTLETALLGTPMVLIYKMHTLSYQIIKRLIKIKQIGLCNIVAQKNLVPELIQHDATPENIASALSQLLSDNTERQKQLDGFSIIREQLKKGNAGQNVAQLALSLMGETA